MSDRVRRIENTLEDVAMSEYNMEAAGQIASLIRERDNLRVQLAELQWWREKYPLHADFYQQLHGGDKQQPRRRRRRHVWPERTIVDAVRRAVRAMTGER